MFFIRGGWGYAPFLNVARQLHSGLLENEIRLTTFFLTNGDYGNNEEDNDNDDCHHYV